jgi:hypothetical protein
MSVSGGIGSFQKGTLRNQIRGSHHRTTLPTAAPVLRAPRSGMLSVGDAVGRGCCRSGMLSVGDACRRQWNSLQFSCLDILMVSYGAVRKAAPFFTQQRD